jgi:tetratricopeptide (TPR) repeat protein
MSRQDEGLQRFRTGNDATNLAQVQLEGARVLVRQGDLEQAHRLLRAAVQSDPACADAWLQLAWLAHDPVERKMLLQRVVSLEPGNRRAQAELSRLDRSLAGDLPPAPRVKARRPWWVLALLAVAALALLAAALVWGPVDSSLARLLPLAAPAPTATPTRTPAEVAAQFYPQLDAALAAGRWARALEIVSIVQSLDPTGEEVRTRARDTHLQVGQALVSSIQAAEALPHFEQVLILFPGDAEALSWRDVTRSYLAGTEALAAGDWATAAETLAQAHDQMPGYAGLRAAVTEAYRKLGTAAAGAEDWTGAIDALSEAQRRSPDDDQVIDLLAAAYRGRGISRQEQGDLQNARSDLETALALRPDDAEARQHYDRVMYLLFPPKRIEVDISAQRFYAWEGDTLLYEFRTSTGLPGRDTATGHFKVLDKIPMAYSSVWRLDMPYWLGIYYVGNIENGIHALPIRPDGTVMWGGLLGQKASYGCIILSTEAAQIIYNWAEVGTEVDIHY